MKRRKKKVNCNKAYKYPKQTLSILLLKTTAVTTVNAGNSLKVSYNPAQKTLPVEDESLNTNSTRFTIFTLSDTAVKSGDLSSKIIEVNSLKGIY